MNFGEPQDVAARDAARVVDRVLDGRHLMPNDELCDACWSFDLAKVKGCVRCLHCGYKADCNGW